MYIVRIETKQGRKFFRKFESDTGAIGFIRDYVADYECKNATEQYEEFEEDYSTGFMEFGLEPVELDIENRVSFEIIKTLVGCFA